MRHFEAALRSSLERRAFGTLLLALPGIALLLTDRGETERAVELNALAARYPVIGASRLFADLAGEQIAAAAATLSSAQIALA